MEEQDRLNKIEELHKQKATLLDIYGVFGGGHTVNRQHLEINTQLESLGIMEDGTDMGLEYANKQLQP